MSGNELVIAGVQKAREQLAKIVGQEKATALVADCLTEAGLTRVETASDLNALSEAMVKRGGIIALIGRTLKVQAILSSVPVTA